VVISGGLSVHEEHGGPSSSDTGPTSCPTLTLDLTTTGLSTRASNDPVTIQTLETHYLLPEPPLLGHGLCVCPLGLCSVGGGVQTFAFAPIFVPPHLLRLPITTPPRPTPLPTLPQSPAAPPSGSDNRPTSLPPVVNALGNGEEATPCLLVRTRDAATVKRALSHLDMLDKGHRIAAVTTQVAVGDGADVPLGGPLMAVPVLPQHFKVLY
jgi:hypothetical protein